MPLSRRFIVIGAGGVGQALVRAIPREWQVTVIDPSAARLRLLPTLWMLRDGDHLREVVGGGALLAAPLTLVIAIIDIGVRAGAVDSVRAGEVIVGGIAGSLLNTSIARRLLRASRRPDGADAAVKVNARA